MSGTLPLSELNLEPSSTSVIIRNVLGSFEGSSEVQWASSLLTTQNNRIWLKVGPRVDMEEIHSCRYQAFGVGAHRWLAGTGQREPAILVVVGNYHTRTVYGRIIRFSACAGTVAVLPGAAGDGTPRLSERGASPWASARSDRQRQTRKTRTLPQQMSACLEHTIQPFSVHGKAQEVHHIIRPEAFEKLPSYSHSQAHSEIRKKKSLHSWPPSQERQKTHV